MVESQEDIDALLAEVNALADEAIADIVGDDVTVGLDLTAANDPETAPPTAAEATSSATSDHQAASTKPAGTASLAVEDPKRILNLEVPVIVQLARRTMPLSDILALTTGAIVEFEKPADSELDLLINNHYVGQGQAVKVGENFGLRVTNIGSLHSRIKAMGKQ